MPIIYAGMIIVFVTGVLLSITAFMRAPDWAQLGMGASICFALVAFIGELVSD